MAESTPFRRLVVHLDSRMRIEELVLNQYECLPERRRQEWLRRLVVQGFIAENQALKPPPQRAARVAVPAAAPRSAPRRMDELPPIPSTLTAAAAVTHDAGEKPFAALARVIG